MNETLRINGEARLTADRELCERLGVEGRPALTVPRRENSRRLYALRESVYALPTLEPRTWPAALSCRRSAKYCATNWPWPRAVRNWMPVWRKAIANRCGNSGRPIQDQTAEFGRPHPEGRPDRFRRPLSRI